jgi:hypothetical protein
MGASRHGFARLAVQFSRSVHFNLACAYDPDGLTAAYHLGGIKQAGNVGTAVW